MYNKLLLLLTFTFLQSIITAQVSRTVVVEHFTNTRCSICANRNPGFYNNLNNQTGVLHLAYHPSAPYSNCIFNQHNVSENDGRTNYYGVYGSTPRLVIQGEEISPGADYSSNTLFAPFTGQMSPVSIRVEQSWDNNDSIEVKAVIKRVANQSLGSLRFFVGLFERQINYDAPNGENLHHDVFRKAMTSIEGQSFNLPSMVGDSVVFLSKHRARSEWVKTEMYAAAILQDESTKEVIQAEAADISDNPYTNISDIPQSIDWRFFPNPINDIVTVKFNDHSEYDLSLFNIQGKLIFKKAITDNTRLDMSFLQSGQYFIRISNQSGEATARLLKL